MQDVTIRHFNSRNEGNLCRDYINIYWIYLTILALCCIWSPNSKKFREESFNQISFCFKRNRSFVRFRRLFGAIDNIHRCPKMISQVLMVIVNGSLLLTTLKIKICSYWWIKWNTSFKSVSHLHWHMFCIPCDHFYKEVSPPFRRWSHSDPNSC